MQMQIQVYTVLCPVSSQLPSQPENALPAMDVYAGYLLPVTCYLLPVTCYQVWNNQKIVRLGAGAATSNSE